jgi:Hydantoinase B/oxoprolinase
MATETGVNVDAFTAEVIRSAVVAITREMKVNLQRTAYNTIIYEAEDFTVGLFDAEGNTISIGLGLPMFIRGLSDTIKAKLAHWGRERIEPGDILLTNDAYTTGSHLNHMIFTLPVFQDGEIVAFSSSMAHWPDVGGVAGTITRDIYSEGLQMPFVKIYKRGSRQTRPDQGQGNCRRRRDDRGLYRGRRASCRLLQLRAHRRPIVRPSRLQMPHDADAPADQRRRPTSTEDHPATRPRDQRDEAGRDVSLDGLPHDGGRYDF